MGSHLCAHEHNASMASSGFRGFRGYFQESEHLRGFACFVARGYFVDFVDFADFSWPHLRTSRRAECTRKTHASPTSRGYWGYWGYFSQVLEITGLFARPHRGYFGGYFRERGFLSALSAGASMRRPQIATMRRIRWDERPETRGNVWLALARARYPCVWPSRLGHQIGQRSTHTHGIGAGKISFRQNIKTADILAMLKKSLKINGLR